MTIFKRPFNVAAERDKFSSREVGFNHPDNKAYVKLCDNGTIEIMSDDALGIIIDPHTRSINIFADTIKVHTRDKDGFRWNRLSFNNRSTKYTEPTFVEYKTSDIVGLYDGIDNILGD